MQRLELPDQLDGHVARALLQLRDAGRFSTETLGLGLQGASMVSRELEQLNWPVKPVPGARPDAWELRAGSAGEEARKRFKSRAFLEWEAEVVAQLSGGSTPARLARAPASSTWSASDYTGQRGAKLHHPEASSPVFRFFFATIHLEVVDPESAEMAPLQFIAAAQLLAESGWPIELGRCPLRAKFRDDVPLEVIAAWRQTFGSRGRHDALQGSLGREAPSSGRR